ncbi:MAG: L-aspartate 1-decarboxylase [Phycisphaerales bacterium]|nr:L-aspartate 1-decarboxylase [Phycisphaerales bacterium]
MSEFILVRLYGEGEHEACPCGAGGWANTRFPPTIGQSMLIKLLRAKIHNATVTQTDVNYHGSITIDADLLAASGLMPNEAVIVADCENGNRFETYVIVGEAGSGVIGINGAAARLSNVGNRVIIMSFVLATADEAAIHRSRVVIADAKNRAAETLVHATTAERSARGGVE